MIFESLEGGACLFLHIIFLAWSVPTLLVYSLPEVPEGRVDWAHDSMERMRWLWQIQVEGYS